jgi:hypothetical protein
MGLDIVEIVVECEKVFGVPLDDRELEQMRTVGELYELICEQLKLAFGPDAPRPREAEPFPRTTPPFDGWTRDTVWSKLVAICVDQLQVHRDDVLYRTNFVDDLGAN